MVVRLLRGLNHYQAFAAAQARRARCRKGIVEATMRKREKDITLAKAAVIRACEAEILQPEK